MVATSIMQGLKGHIPRFLARRYSAAHGVYHHSRSQFGTQCRFLAIAALSNRYSSSFRGPRCPYPQNDKTVTPFVRFTSTASEIAKPSAIEELSGRDLVLSPPALVVTREYEWANILVGFEQANKYTIRAAPGGQVVGYLAEVCFIS